MSDLREQMECFRPDRDDLSAAELAALREALAADASVRDELESIQAWDRAVAAKISDVPVPDGLAGRLMERPTLPAARWWQTWPALATAAVTAAALLLVAGLWLLRGTDNLTGPAIAQDARGWVTQIDQQSWSTAPLPSDHPRDPAFRFPASRWQRIEALGDPRAVIYYGELAPDRSAAYLVVIETRRGGHLSSIPPPTPDASTEGFCIGSWKTDDHLYVFVVPGTPSLYRRALRTHGLPIT
jgi:hypothetical protein